MEHFISRWCGVVNDKTENGEQRKEDRCHMTDDGNWKSKVGMGKAE